MNVDNVTAQVIAIASSPLLADDWVSATGWGLTGPTGTLSNILRRSNLQISKGGRGEKIFTKVSKNLKGEFVDTCSGDSGGPLLKWCDERDGYEIHGTVHGKGYDCYDDKVNGTGCQNM